MKYRESTKDKQLRTWFTNDNSCALLRRILLRSGSFRGVNSLDILLNFPITAIAGKNGAGKSTILALACCAYHNTKSGFKLPKRKTTYYTFSDFFIQHKEEVPPQGIEILYGIAYNKWKKTPSLPEGVGIGYQLRKKKKGGKWTDYDKRVRKTVIFLGIERIVPHIERSQSRSYSKVFQESPPSGWENQVKDVVGSILGKTYDEFRRMEHSRYSLSLVRIGDVIYSGLNMGAGENALFEIFSVIYACEAGSLIVIDEIELGLHVEAQKKFIHQLKIACIKKRSQVICTTHSREIFDCLPYDARFFIECVNNKTRVTEAISSDFAFAKMGAIFGKELDILVEDNVAKTILVAAFPAGIRYRVTMTVIGSASALARQLAAIYLKGEERPCLAIFDGDQRTKNQQHIHHAKSMAETADPDFEKWCAQRICYLPGDTWPEAWLVQKGAASLHSLSETLGTEPDNLSDLLQYGLQAEKHYEFHEIAKQLGLEVDACMQLFARAVCVDHKTEFDDVVDRVASALRKNA